MNDEIDLLAYAERQAVDYVQSLEARPVFPDEWARQALSGFEEALPEQRQDPAAVLEQLSRLGAPATVASAGPNYYGFVIGSSLPVASAAERIALAWGTSNSAWWARPTVS